jgi:hypothetical protein
METRLRVDKGFPETALLPLAGMKEVTDSSFELNWPTPFPLRPDSTQPLPKAHAAHIIEARNGRNTPQPEPVVLGSLPVR